MVRQRTHEQAERQMMNIVCRRLLPLFLAPLMVSPAAAQRLHADGVRELTEQIAAGVAKERKSRIGVVSFADLDGRSTIFGRLLAEDLTTRLVGAGSFEVVERAMLDKVFAELKLSATGVIDPSTAARIGRLAGVDGLVTGSIAELPSSVAVNCRLIDVQTGRIFGAAQTRIVKDDDVKAILSRPLGGLGADPGKSSPPRSVAQAVVLGFQFEVEACTRRGGGVSCALWITSLRDDKKLYIANIHGTMQTAFWDDLGNEYPSAGITVGNKKMDFDGVQLVAGIRTRATFDVEGAVAGKSLSRIVFFMTIEGRGYSEVVLKDVPIQ
jgi:curli biogenesis system outer membrane secretion channel CsgG